MSSNPKGILVQTGSIPALLHGLRQAEQRFGPEFLVLALDSENVRQYLREIPGIKTRYFQSPAEAVSILKSLPPVPILYLSGRSFPRLRRAVRKFSTEAAALHPEQEPDWNDFLGRFHAQVRRDSVVLLQSDSPEVIEAYVSSRLELHRFQRPSFSIVCREEESAYWARAHPDWRVWTYRDGTQLLRLSGILRRQHFDACLVFFTGNFGYSPVKRIAMLAGARQCVAVNEHGGFIQLTALSLLQFGYQRRRHPAPPKWGDAPRILLVQGEDAPLTLEVLERVQSDGIFRSPRISVLAEGSNHDALARAPGVAEIVLFPRDARSAWTTARRLRREQFDAAVITRPQVPALVRAVLILAGIHHRLFLERQHYFFKRSALRQRYWVRKHGGLFQTTRVLLIQTCSAERLGRAIRRLAEASPFYKPEYSLLAQRGAQAELGALDSFEQILTLPETARFGDLLEMRRQIRSQRFDAATVVLSSDRGFARWKWLPFLSGISPTLLFNRNLDCFLFTPGQLLRYLRNRGGMRVLVVSTWDEPRMRRILERLGEVKPFPQPTYSLFVREDRRHLLEGALPFEEILTYPLNPGLLDWWRCIVEIRKQRFDVAVIAFTGEASFGKLKLLPFAAGIRHKLVFNRNYDCFFFSLLAFGRYLISRYGDTPGKLLLACLLPLVRGALFPFRFAYLLLRVTGYKLQRAARMKI